MSWTCVGVAADVAADPVPSFRRDQAFLLSPDSALLKTGLLLLLLASSAPWQKSSCRTLACNCALMLSPLLMACGSGSGSGSGNVVEWPYFLGNVVERLDDDPGNIVERLDGPWLTGHNVRSQDWISEGLWGWRWSIWSLRSDSASLSKFESVSDVVTDTDGSSDWKLADQAQESLGPFGPEVARSVPESVPENGGCPRECPTGCLRGPSGPGLQTVQKVSRECPRSVRDTLLRLQGHFLDPSEPGARRAPQTPRRTLPRTPPVFGDTPGTLWARRARETPVPGRRVPNPLRAMVLFLFDFVFFPLLFGVAMTLSHWSLAQQLMKRSPLASETCSQEYTAICLEYHPCVDESVIQFKRQCKRVVCSDCNLPLYSSNRARESCVLIAICHSVPPTERLVYSCSILPSMLRLDSLKKTSQHMKWKTTHEHKFETIISHQPPFCLTNLTGGRTRRKKQEQTARTRERKTRRLSLVRPPWNRTVRTHRG